tara:strand:+ start:1622 stop:2725 length:1104 start_codon:yes stop_codon:yes gene_type:complete
METYNATIGNWKQLNLDELRLKPTITLNKGFFSSFAYIHQCIPYLEKKYFDKNIKLNIQYFSHNYGVYPNFQVIGDYIQLNYIPDNNVKNKQFDELICLGNLFRKICGTQTRNEETNYFYSFKNNFKLANEIFFRYFKFSEEINNIVEIFSKQFENKKVLGLHYRGTDKNKVNWVNNISIDEFLIILDDHLVNNKYDILFLSTDDSYCLKKIKEKYKKKYTILTYDNIENEDNNSIHLNRLKLMTKIVKDIKKSLKHQRSIDELENKLKHESLINNNLLKDVIICSLILSKCNLVLKTHSQVSAYAKIFNPELEIYRTNACFEGYWPDSHIPLLDCEKINNIEVKNLVKKKTKNEFSSEKKYAYKNM